MAYLFKGQEVIIYGAGKKGKILYYKLRSKYKIKAFIDNNKSKGEVFGVPVYTLEEIRTHKENCKIIISSLIYENDMMQSLCNLGYEFFEDFVPAYLIDTNSINVFELYEKFKMFDKVEKLEKALDVLSNGRKVAIIHGNCQTACVKGYLLTNKEFTDKYIFWVTPRIFHLTCLEKYNVLKELNLLYKVDLFITQQISDENRFHRELSTNNMIALLRKDCRIVKIANMFFLGYHPQHKANEHKILEEFSVSGKGLFMIGESNVDDLLAKGCSTDEIIEKLNDENFYSKEYLENRARIELENLKEREKIIDVKMADYIEANYKKEILFHSCDHPIEKLLFELSKRILLYLGNEDTNVYYSSCHEALKYQDEPIYPAVIKAFGLDERYKNQLYYPNKFMDSSILLSFDDYIRTYIEMCHGIYE